MFPSDAEISRPRLDRQLWLAVLVTACVIIPRTVLVSRAHSDYWDDQYHLRHGLAFLLREPAGEMRQDAPLGQAVLALPMLLAGCREISDKAVLLAQPLRPETISTLVAAWKALLFLPFAALVFHWCRRLYGVRGGWLGLALVLAEPTVAGHIAPAALDVLGAEVSLVACYLAWRYFAAPTRGRLAAAGVATAAAMLTKHTAVITPAVVTVYALAYWLRDRGAAPGGARPEASLRRRLNQVLAGALVAAAAIWPLTLFDVSRPSTHGPLVNAVYTEAWSFKADAVNGALMRPLPAGVYIGSVRGGQFRADAHDSYLWGRRSKVGWWYYFLAVGLYKVLIGVALVMGIAAASVFLVRPRFEETPLVVAAVAWGVFLSVGGIHIGFRHALPAYVPLLMLCARVAATTVKPLHWLAWAGVAAAALHTHLWHPDYLSYINFPRDKPYLAISDSNVDWGQSLKQVRRWLDAHPQPGRPVWIGYFGPEYGRSVRYYLGDAVRELGDTDPAPSSGLLIISPVWVAGGYGHGQYAFLRGRTPDAVIGHSMLVYDLDRPVGDRLAE